MEIPCTWDGPKRVDGDGGHQRRVDATRQADDRLGEPVLAQIVPRAQHQRGIDLGLVGECRAQGRRGARGSARSLGPRFGGDDPGQRVARRAPVPGVP